MKILAVIKRWGIRLLPLFYAVLVWLQSSWFDPESVGHITWIGNALEMGHFFLFAILYILLIWAVSTYGRITWRKELVVVFLVVCCALVDEFHQFYVPHRSASLDDLLKDFAGIIVAWWLVRMIRRRRRTRHQSHR